MEATLGLLALLLVALCVLAWRLAQGPIDLTWLIQREQPATILPGARLSFGGADLAWEGFAAENQPLVVRLSDVSLVPDGGPKLHVDQARVRFAEGPLLLGRVTPRSIALSGVRLDLQRDQDGAWRLGSYAGPSRHAVAWPVGLGTMSVQDGTLTVQDSALGLTWRATGVALDLHRDVDNGLAGQGRAMLRAGGVETPLTVQAVPDAGPSLITATVGPVNPAALAALSPGLAALGRLDAQVSASLKATLKPDLSPANGQLDLSVGQGTMSAGQGSVRLSSATASLFADASEMRLDKSRLVLAGQQGSGPIVTATGRATRDGDRLKAGIGVDLDSVAMAELTRYWPTGTGGGARAWLTRNITAGTARQVHAAAELDAPADLSDVKITALSGGLALEDATVWWLRPVPPVVHADARLVIEGPDALRITVQSGRQDRLALLPGSAIRITGLQARDQFADIDATLSGPVADALSLLDHPRLKLLSRGGVEVVDPAGAVRAELAMHVPLDDRVTMDDIGVSAHASLSGVHLGRVVAGRDLDRADLTAMVTGAGLTIEGRGNVAGIPAKLALTMEFRAGPPSQVLQHLTAQGQATPAQLLTAGLPADAVHVLTDGPVALSVDYTGRRSAAATLQIDADLGQTSVTTPFGWSKPAGPPATAGGLVTLDHGRFSGVDNLHAEGPGLAIVSRAVVTQRVKTLQLQRFDLGRTSAHGQIGFPQKADTPITVALSGPTLDLSGYFGQNDTHQDAPPAPDDKPGLPWSAKLDFGRVFLAHDVSFAPLHVNAASNGRRILHAAASAGTGLAASVTPVAGGRHVRATAVDAGGALAGFGVAGLAGGNLKLDGNFDDTKAETVLTGATTMDGFNIRDAPAIGRLLQDMTLYGFADTLHGPGLYFSHLIAPFRWQRRVLHLSNARAYSPSLGLTADGVVDLAKRTANLRGTVVPAYFFNQLLGDLPLIGRLFSPEKGGGVFAARYAVRGPLANLHVGVNPLSALTPGFLRGVFGVFDPKPAGDHVQ